VDQKEKNSILGNTSLLVSYCVGMVNCEISQKQRAWRVAEKKTIDRT